MEQYYQDIVHAIEGRLPLEAMASLQELGEIGRPLRLFSLRCRNMRAEKIRNI